MNKLRHAIVALKVAIAGSTIFAKWDKTIGYYYEKKTFKKKNGYELNLKNPRTFNEKVVRKKLYDRNALLYITGDKAQIKEYLEENLGFGIAKKITIPTLYVGSDLENIPFESLPDEYIIKGCHLSGYNLIITTASKLTRKEILYHCKFLLKKDITNPSHAWYYKKIPKRIIIEPLIKDEEGKLPQDYKFYCFNGRVKMFQVDFDRFGSMRRSLFDISGNLIFGSIKYDVGDRNHNIMNLNEIIKFVESLTFNLDFVRVDIYIINNRPVFGELTHYPGAGYSKILPFELDLELGNYWI